MSTVMRADRILIVEDEAIIAREIESQLQSLGYEVTSIVDTDTERRRLEQISVKMVNSTGI